MTKLEGQKDTIDSLVRDLTEVAPRPKSEVKRRLKALIEAAERRGIEKCVENVMQEGFILFQVNNLEGLRRWESKIHSQVDHHRGFMDAFHGLMRALGWHVMHAPKGPLPPDNKQEE